MNAKQIEDVLGLASGSLQVVSDGGTEFTIPELTNAQKDKLKRVAETESSGSTNGIWELEADGFLTSFGIKLGASTSDQAQWIKLNTHLDLAHDALAKSSNKTWEQVRRDFEAKPIKVQTYDGTVWSTTIGNWRSAFLELTGAYLAAWSSGISDALPTPTPPAPPRRLL